MSKRGAETEEGTTTPPKKRRLSLSSDSKASPAVEARSAKQVENLFAEFGVEHAFLRSDPTNRPFSASEAFGLLRTPSTPSDGKDSKAEQTLEFKTGTFGSSSWVHSSSAGFIKVDINWNSDPDESPIKQYTIARARVGDAIIAAAATYTPGCSVEELKRKVSLVTCNEDGSMIGARALRWEDDLPTADRFLLQFVEDGGMYCERS